MPSASQAKKVAIVTGASAGIGKAAVLKFLKEGFKVHAAARRLEAMDDLKKAGAEVHFLDLKKPDTIAAFVAKVISLDHRVDVLVNNAGYGSYGAVEEVPMSEARAQIEVNLFAAAQLIQEVLPTMRAQRFGRIINISSIGGKIWSPLGAWYHASKFALEGLSDSLRNEVRPFGIDVIVIEPGGIKTEWGQIAVENMLKISSQGPYKSMAAGFAKLAQGPQADKIAAAPEVIGDLIVYVAEAKRPKTRYVAPFSGKAILFIRSILSDRAFDWFFGIIFKIPKKL